MEIVGSSWPGIRILTQVVYSVGGSLAGIIGGEVSVRCINFCALAETLLSLYRAWKVQQGVKRKEKQREKRSRFVCLVETKPVYL